MLIHRWSLVLLGLLGLLAIACTAKQDTKEEKQSATPQPASSPSEPATPAPATPAPASGPTVALMPGQAIGPVSFGMAKADVEALGFETHPQFSAMTIPISVYYDDADKVKTIEISLMHSDKDVTISELTVPRSASVEQIRELLGDCQEPEVNIGATMHSCRNGTVFIAIGSGNPDEVWLRIDKP
jgi:hypothetical protein